MYIHLLHSTPITRQVRRDYIAGGLNEQFIGDFGVSKVKDPFDLLKYYIVLRARATTTTTATVPSLYPWPPPPTSSLYYIMAGCRCLRLRYRVEYDCRFMRIYTIPCILPMCTRLYIYIYTCGIYKSRLCNVLMGFRFMTITRHDIYLFSSVQSYYNVNMFLHTYKYVCRYS